MRAANTRACSLRGRLRQPPDQRADPESRTGRRHRRLVDEVALITSVSGGSFTALSYVLYGDKLFSEYEMRFLERYVQGDLIGGTVK